MLLFLLNSLFTILPVWYLIMQCYLSLFLIIAPSICIPRIRNSSYVKQVHVISFSATHNGFSLSGLWSISGKMDYLIQWLLFPVTVINRLILKVAIRKWYWNVYVLHWEYILCLYLYIQLLLNDFYVLNCVFMFVILLVLM